MLFRKMRRDSQRLPTEQTLAILRDGRSGVLAVCGDDGYPYAVPLSYAYEEGTLYFHCAVQGHKLDGIRRSDKVSFCVTQQDQPLPEKLTTLYRSVVLFGRAKIVEDPALRRHALELLVRKYAPDFAALGAVEIRRTWDAVCIVALTVEHLSGKQAKELC